MELDERLVQRQIELEEESVNLGISKYRETLRESKNQADLPPGMMLLKRAMEPFTQAINIFRLPKAGGMKFGATRSYFNKFPQTEDIAYIAAKRIFEAMAKDEPVQKVAISIACNLQDHLELLKYKKEAPGHYKKVEENLKTSDLRHRRTVILYAKRKIGIDDDTLMTEKEKLAIGSKLIELFIQSTGLVEMVQEPSKVIGRDGKYILQATSSTLEWLEKQHAKCEVMSPFYLPMVSIPRDWTTVDDGGFYSIPLNLVKTRNKKALEDLRNHSMPLVYKAVNALQRTPWRINKKVYEVLNELWSTGQTLGGLPSQEEAPLPNTPWNSDDEFNYLKETQPEIVKEWKRKASKVHEQRMKEKSHRISMSYKMFVADKMKDEDRFYFCWNLDWRGRLYPVQSHVNPQSDDIGKALLEFAEGKPLGERGVYWLKIHLANLYSDSIVVNGVKKKTDKVKFEERVKWVDDNRDLILDSANNPLDGYRFWSKADCPFEFLAACFEYAGYIREGISYISHLPIALDGSCNGLQNFSAMLRDEIGARAVNLVPLEEPNDIYNTVADVLSKEVERDSQDRVTLYPPKPKKPKRIKKVMWLKLSKFLFVR